MIRPPPKGKQLIPKLTGAQVEALTRFARFSASAIRLHPMTARVLQDRGLIAARGPVCKRPVYTWYTLTEAGRAALRARSEP